MAGEFKLSKNEDKGRVIYRADKGMIVNLLTTDKLVIDLYDRPKVQKLTVLPGQLIANCIALNLSL